MTVRLDVSIGPVQGFVSQSRRTRDLWGSSYLLAFLSAHAMRGAVEAGGRLVVPAAEAVEQDRLYQWVRVHHESEPPGAGVPERPRGPRSGARGRHEYEDEQPPRIGSLPNHFAVEVEGNGSEVARAGIRSLRTAWEQVCDAVWSTFVEPACLAGNGTEDIWSRQVDSFWEVTWTAGNPAGDAGAAGGLLARRKHWRSHHPPEEPGDKCTVMHTLQELSGFVRARDGARQDEFWHRIRSKPGGGLGLLDLRENERLCAIALVKRMFPKVAREALGWEVDASRWPSTVYVGALPWMRRVMSAVPPKAAEYAEAVRQGAGDGARSTRPLHPDSGVSNAGDFPKLDANFLHREFVADERRCPLAGEASPGVRKELVERLGRLYDATDEQGRRLGPPPAFHALLLADGDRLGALAGRLGGKSVSKALTVFTGKAPEIVRKHDGVTVYAGGDDVLAMLPIPRALACAKALSDAYRDAFAGIDDGAAATLSALPLHRAPTVSCPAAATLSAAVVFAHVRLPLNHVLREAHRLLDDVAKDRNGRNSLAAAVLKPGGPYCEWTTTWTRGAREGEAGAVDLVETLASQLEAGRDSATPGLSSALVYRIRELLVRVCGWEQWRPGSWGDVPDHLAKSSCCDAGGQWRPGSRDDVPGDLGLRALLRAEIAHSLETRMDDGAAASAERAEHLTTGVWNLLSPARNPQGGGVGAAAAGNGSTSPSPRAGGPRLDDGASTAAAGNGTASVSQAGVDGRAPGAGAPGSGSASISRAGVDGLLLARFLADPEAQEFG